MIRSTPWYILPADQCRFRVRKYQPRAEWHLNGAAARGKSFLNSGITTIPLPICMDSELLFKSVFLISYPYRVPILKSHGVWTPHRFPVIVGPWPIVKNLRGRYFTSWRLSPAMKPFCFRRVGSYPLLRYSCQHSLLSYVQIRKPYPSTMSWVFRYPPMSLIPLGQNLGILLRPDTLSVPLKLIITDHWAITLSLTDGCFQAHRMVV